MSDKQLHSIKTTANKKYAECKSCTSLSGEQRISPGPTIYSGNYWVVEHAYPTEIKGWLVLALKRHITALHDLTSQEWAEMYALQNRFVNILHKQLSTKKEYIAVFAESPGFEHIHVHIIPRTDALPKGFRGPKVFGLIGEKVATPIPPSEVIQLCQALNKLF